MSISCIRMMTCRNIAREPCRNSILAVLAAAMVLMPSQASAQVATPQAEIRRDTGNVSEAQRAAEDARNLQALEDQPVNFADLLQRPDDLDLNFRYARQQVREGDLKGASVTLERILLIDPEQPAVRLLYAVVLVRLDNYPDAERELRELAALPLPPDIRLEVERYLGQIRRRQQDTRFTASVSVGGEYNSNPTSIPRNQLSRVSDAYSMTSGPQRDVAKAAIASLGVRHDLGFQDGHEIFANTSFYLKSHSDPAVRTQDVRAYSFDFGTAWRFPNWVDISPSLLFSRVDLARDRYLEAPGAKLLLERKITDSLDTFAHALIQRENVQAQTDNPSFHERSGRFIQYSGGMGYTLGPTHRLTLTYNNDFKDLARNYNSYRSNGAIVGHSWLLGSGQFLISSFGSSLDEYRENDPLVSAMRRRDWTFRFRTTYGVPMATAAGLAGLELPAHLADVVFTSTVELSKTGSTLETYNLRNAKVQFLFNKRVEF